MGFIVIFGYTFFMFSSKKAKQYSVENHTEIIDAKSGVYSGEYKFTDFIVLAKIQFEVIEGKITNIQLKKLANTRTHKCENELIQRIENCQQIDFDAISGATGTSNFAKAALANAFVKDNIK